MPKSEVEDVELGDALHARLSQLAARLERLTAGAQGQPAAGDTLTEARRASETFAAESEPGRREAPILVDTPPPVNRAATPSPDPAPRLEPIEEPKTDQAAAETRLRAIRERIEALKTKHGTTPNRGKGSARSGNPDPIPERVAPRRPEPPVAKKEPAPKAANPKHAAIDFNAAIAEIAARQKMIDESAEASAAPAPTVPANPANVSSGGSGEAENAAIAELRQRMDQLTLALAKGAEDSADPQRTSGPQSPRPQPAIQAKTSDLDLSPIHAAQADMSRRLDHLLRRSEETDLSEVAQQILHRMPSGDRFDALSAEIDKLADRIATVDRGQELAQIDERLGSFQQQLAAALRTPEGSKDNQRVEAEIAGVRDAVEGLYRMLHNEGSPALARLERRLTEVSDRLESTLASAPRADSVTDLLGRLELIAARGETAPAALESLASEIAELRARERSELANLDTHIQALADRLDEAITGQSKGSAAAQDLEGRIGSLSQRLDELAQAEPSDRGQEELRQLEDQLGLLSTRFDDLDSSDPSSAGIARLEEQVASLLQRLELLASDHDTLRTVQDNLARLEGIVIDSELQTFDTVQTAARDAVRELSGLGDSQDSEVVDALKGDLRELQDAAHSNDQQTSATLDNVHHTLDRVVSRLGDMEDDVAENLIGRFRRVPVAIVDRDA